MMWTTKGVDMAEDIIKRRAQWLRDITQGEGVTDMDKVLLMRDDWKEMFPVDDAEELESVLKYAVERDFDNPFVQAYANAFEGRREGESGPWLNLTERRTSYLRENPSVSYRTLIRHEAEGAEVIARYVDAALRVLAEEKREPDASEGLEIDLELLRQRVADLEATLGILVAAVNAQTGLVRDLTLPSSGMRAGQDTKAWLRALKSNGAMTRVLERLRFPEEYMPEAD
jgi:hypothetical protein